MDRKVGELIGGIRLEIIPGVDGAVALDELVDDFLHGDMGGALHAFHNPHGEKQGEGSEADSPVRVIPAQ